MRALDDTLNGLLAQYDLVNPVVTPMIEGAQYLIDTHGGRYVLKMQQISVTKRSLEKQARTLEFLATRPTADIVPRLLSSKENDVITHYGDYRGVVTTFITGTHPHVLTNEPSLLLRIGTFLGRWHSNNLVQLERSKEIEILFGENGLYPIEEVFAFIHPSFRQIVDQSLHKIQQHLTYPHHAAFLHGDFLPQNILIDNDIFRLIDFEYSRYGHRMIDLAPIAWLVRVRQDWVRWQSIFLKGYAKSRHTNGNDLGRLESFIVARHIASLHWIAHNPDNPHVYPHAEAILAHRITELEGFLKTGLLRRTTFVA